MKKLLSGVLVVVLILTFCSTLIFASENPSEQALEQLGIELKKEFSNEQEKSTITQFIESYKNDNAFSEHYRNSPEDALLMVKNVIESVIHSEKEADTYWFSGNVAGVDNVPVLKQATNYYCGVASALQVIVSKGASSRIPGNDYNEKQVNLDRDYFHIPHNGSAMVYQVRNCINNYTSTQYAYIRGDTISITQFKAMIHGSLRNNNPPILHAIPKYLPYYPNTATTGHYITVVGINYDNDTITLNDCNYQPPYNGLFTVSITDAYNAIAATSERYLIHGF